MSKTLEICRYCSDPNPLIYGERTCGIPRKIRKGLEVSGITTENGRAFKIKVEINPETEQQWELCGALRRGVSDPDIIAKRQLEKCPGYNMDQHKLSVLQSALERRTEFKKGEKGESVTHGGGIVCKSRNDLNAAIDKFCRGLIQ